MIERVFNDRYRLEGPVGRGGMATVFAATDTLLRRRVAIKVLRAELAHDGGFVDRFYSEAQHAAKLAHPNIVNVYDVGRAGDDYFIVMEFVDGTTLAEMIEGDGKLPEPVAVDYATQVCNGLAYAHRQGLLHRDIKPANILVTKDDVVKLSDFGIARAVSSSAVALTQPGMVMGSVYYVSPEQAQGQELTPASDLYSLGVVIFQMLTGELPYTGETPVTVALKHVSYPVPAIDTARAAISPALAAIVSKLLQKDPAARFRSAAELATALREARDRPLDAVTVPEAAPVAAGLDDPEVPPPRPRRLAAAAQARTAERRGRFPFMLVAAIAGAIVVLAAFAAFEYTTMHAPAAPQLADVRGLDVDAATSRLQSDGFNVHVSTQPSESIAQGRVIEQTPRPPATAQAHATIELAVSAGMPAATLSDVRRFSRDDAERSVRGLKLTPKVIEKFDAAPKGTVLAQSPAAGARVPLHGVVTLTVSKGAKPIAVPDLVSLPVARAAQALAASGLSIDVTQRMPSDSIAPNTVISQDPKAGSTVDAATKVSVVVSSGVVTLAIPDAVTQTIGDATRSLSAAGFTPSIVYVVQASRQSGVVIDQRPAAGSKVPRDSTVVLTVAVSGAIPDVGGMSLDTAKQTLIDAGYRIGNVAYTQKGAESTAAYTEPAGGSSLRPGEAVTIYYNAPGAH